MVWLDLEGTIIDDLSNRNWLDTSKIAMLGSEFGIFTWGWWDETEIDWDLVHAIEERFSDEKIDFLKKKCTRVVTKKDCMDFMFTHGQWFFDGWKDGFEEYKKNVSNDSFLQCCAEENFNEKFSKEDCFVEMFKHEKLSWLFDDTIKDDKKITFLDNDNTVILFNPKRK